jgi:hypothetical protein
VPVFDSVSHPKCLLVPSITEVLPSRFAAELQGQDGTHPLDPPTVQAPAKHDAW